MTISQHELTEAYGTELEAFGIWLKNNGMTFETQRAYLSDTRRFLRLIYPEPVGKTGKIHIMKYLSEARERGAGDEARNRKLSALRAFYKSLNEMDLATGNPAALTSKSKMQKNRLPIYLEEDELEEMLRCVGGKYRYRNLAILLLMTYAGLRVGEVHRLNVDDVQRDGSIHVLGKGRKWRVIPLPAALHQALALSLEQRLQPRGGREQPLFVSQFGRRLSVRMIQTIAEQTFARLKERMPDLAVQKLSCHKLRHSFATMQIRSGTDIRTLQELLGHTSIETTQIYAHIDNRQLKKAMGNIADKIPVWEV
ncbi:tyrosine-type recombinase/integrase [Paenibacillus thailandensis]|uniref:Tyrosine-type recombinase/integrase n=1 Tax=Paenibacillus thailandensis TaxID=393250 RepID=A0ABW5QWC7_9BACL